jgi:hypothetical protein
MPRSSFRRARVIAGILGITILVPLAAYGASDLRGALASRRARWEAKMKAEGRDPSALKADGKFMPRAKDAEPILTQPKVDPTNQRGVYLTSGSIARTQFFEDTLNAIKAAGGSAVVFDVKGYYVYFDTSAGIAHEIDSVHPVYDLPAAVAKAKEKGIYTIARFISLKDEYFAGKVPEAQIRNGKTNRTFGSTWTDGSHPITLEYNKQIIKDLLASGIDEINLDYIRYPTHHAPSQINLTGAEKAERVLTFIKMVRDTINEVRPETKLGISTYAIMGWSFAINLEPLGQDFVKFAPYVDIISPMAYPATFAEGAYYIPGKHPRSRMYYLVYRTMTGYRDLLPEGERYKLRPWIQGYSASTADMREQMDAVYDAGYCGFQIWSAGNNYGVSYPAIKAEGTRPERCRTQ